MESKWSQCRNQQQYFSKFNTSQWRCGNRGNDIITCMCKSNNSHVKFNYHGCNSKRCSIGKHCCCTGQYNMHRNECHLHWYSNQWRHTIVSMESKWSQCRNQQQYFPKFNTGQWRCGNRGDDRSEEHTSEL